MGMSVLAVAGEGCMLTVSQPPFGIDMPERPEIGTYYWKCPAEDAERLKTLVLPAMAEGRASKGQVVARGTRFLTFGLGKSADEVEAYSVPLERPLAPAIQVFDAAVIKLARAVQDHPYMILRASGTTGTRTLEPDGELSITVKLANAGVVPWSVHNPALAPAALKIALVDSDNDWQFLDPVKGEIVASFGKEPDLSPATGPLVTLQPGEILSLEVKMRRHPYLKRGTYRVVARYTSEKTGIPEMQRVGGFLNVEAGTITVPGKSPAPKKKGRP